MNLPQIVSRDEWLAARKELLAREKAMTRAIDELNADRRRLPMVLVDKPYKFEGPDGTVGLLDLFDGSRQLIVQHVMWLADEGRACPSCTADVDEMANGFFEHLRARDTNLVLVSRGPLDDMQRYQEERGWTVPWYSSAGSDFNYDFHVTMDESVTPVEYNYRTHAEWQAMGATLVKPGRVGRAARAELLPARRRRPRLPHLLDLRSRHRSAGRRLPVPRHHRARPAGGMGGAEGTRRERVERVSGLLQPASDQLAPSLPSGSSGPPPTRPAPRAASGAACGCSTRTGRPACPPNDRVPVGLAQFANDFVSIRHFAERDHHNIVSWNSYDAPGHYAARQPPAYWSATSGSSSPAYAEGPPQSDLSGLLTRLSGKPGMSTRQTGASRSRVLTAEAGPGRPNPWQRGREPPRPDGPACPRRSVGTDTHAYPRLLAPSTRAASALVGQATENLGGSERSCQRARKLGVITEIHPKP